MARIKRVQGNATPASETVEDPTTTHTSAATTTTTVAAAAPTTKPTRRRRRGRTSSERGRAFRKRQDNQEALLEQQVAKLQQEIHDKQFLLSVCEAKYLRSKHSVHGPLVAIAVEYFRMFQFGSRHFDTTDVLSSCDRDLMKRQEAYVHSVMDPDVVISLDIHTVCGPEAVPEQWRLRTLVAPDFSVEVVSPPAVIGPDENPVVQVQLQGSCCVTPQFVDVMCKLPAHAAASRLLKNCVGKTLKVSMRAYLQFSPDKRINLNIVQADYVQSFMDLGLSLHEVAELLNSVTLTPQLTLESAKYPSDSEEKYGAPAEAY